MTAHWMTLNLLHHSLDLSRPPHLKFVMSSATDIVFEIQALDMDLAPFKMDIDELLADYAKVFFPSIFCVS
jgi:hypothetical protein